ncbi:spheroidene monooxygenase [Shivajiella indica]|uniref:Spheroidene monooxygenase n=1 Tax=Shivajiella indica TaxID=872115 RepID=A0ABW5B8F5_9BACT
MNDNQCVTISFFKFEGIINKIWGFAQLVISRLMLSRNEQVEFFKPLGSGSGLGYKAWPRFGLIGLLVVWKNKEDALAFTESSYFQSLLLKSEEQFTVFMKPVSSRGTWSGFGNWKISENDSSSEVICAITRATIKRKFLFDFWRMVPDISKNQYNFPGLIFSQGVGEVPLLEQATFTIWENKQSMESFAYRSFHGKAIEKVRRENGFKEQMFTRFQPVMVFGTWDGKHILEKYGIPSYSMERVEVPVLI